MEATLQPKGSSLTGSVGALAEALKKKLTPKASSNASHSTSISNDPKIILHLMRHAEAEHNLAHIHGRNRADYPDPELTEHGLEQCQHARETFPYMGDIDFILSSPLRRTTQTALNVFQPLYARELKLVLWSALREWGNGASNVGSTITDMGRDFSSLPVDLRLLNEGWELETDPEEEGAQRSNRVREDLFDLGQILLTGGAWKGIPIQRHDRPVCIMVVSHGGFLTNLMCAKGPLRNTGYRSFSFASGIQVAQGISKYQLFEYHGEANASKPVS